MMKQNEYVIKHESEYNEPDRVVELPSIILLIK